MTETQILTIALASVPSVIAVLIGILINNSRLNDTNARISELHSQLNSQMESLRSHFDRRFDDMREHLAG